MKKTYKCKPCGKVFDVEEGTEAICPVCGACNTHLPNCPEYEKSIPAQCRCTECGNGIENGESYYQIGEHIICNYCIDDFKHIMDMDDYSYEDYLTEKYERERDDV